MSAQYPVLVAVTGPAEALLVQTIETERDVVVVSRCVDLAELLALAGTGRAVAALVSADLRHLDRSAVARLRASGLAVVGVVDVDEPTTGSRLAALGISARVEIGTDGAGLVVAIGSALDDPGSSPGWGHADPANELDRLLDDPTDPRFGLDESRSVSAGFAGQEAKHRQGRVVAVWGPAGSPGRTTVAVNLAAELAEHTSCLLADADTYGASVAQTLGILEEAPGLAAACRSAAAGTLDLVALARLSPLVGARLRVLTGITRSDRWPELAGAGLEAVWELARSLAEWTVIDCGFSLEHDEELSYDTLAPRRNAATLVSLERADLVVAVGSADPVGLQRLVRGLAELAEVVPGVRPQVVLTKVRASAVGANPVQRVRDSLRRYAGIEEVLIVPDDRASLDAALLAGRSVAEFAPGSQICSAMGELATALASAPVSG